MTTRTQYLQAHKDHASFAEQKFHNAGYSLLFISVASDASVYLKRVAEKLSITANTHEEPYRFFDETGEGDLYVWEITVADPQQFKKLFWELRKRHDRELFSHTNRGVIPWIGMWETANSTPFGTCGRTCIVDELPAFTPKFSADTRWSLARAYATNSRFMHSVYRGNLRDYGVFKELLKYMAFFFEHSKIKKEKVAV